MVVLLLGSSLGSVACLESGFCWVLIPRAVVRSRGEVLGRGVGYLCKVTVASGGLPGRGRLSKWKPLNVFAYLINYCGYYNLN